MNTTADLLATIPDLGRRNYREYFAAMGRVFDRAHVRDLGVGDTIIHAKVTMEILSVDPHRDELGRLIRNWVGITYRLPSGDQRRMGFCRDSLVFVPCRPWLTTCPGHSYK